ncbi:MAG: Macrolide export ATP-binding/permease protein MacB [Haliscomenobacter sp.]|nr:Macrolide export ATP-binding/permease protein MacB [Haliscomenobacter sp.]
MTKHLLKLIWNKKRHHGLVIAEILVSFLVLFGLFSLVLYNGQNYRQPLGFRYQNTWALNLNSGSDTTALIEKVNQIVGKIRTYPEVKAASLTESNTPFSMNTSNRTMEYKGVEIISDVFFTDFDYPKVLDINIRQGRWFQKSDLTSTYRPVVLNQEAAQRLFGAENPLGKVLGSGENPNRVVGVIGNFKSRGEYTPLEPAAFELANPQEHRFSACLIQVKPGVTAEFEARMMKDLGAMAKGWNLELSYLANQRKSKNQIATVPALIFAVICGFLLLNVALGLFGVLNLNINKRRDEIGLRRALGASATGITRQFVAEMWLLTAIGVAIGLIFAVQFPILHIFDLPTGVYTAALFLALASIYALVTVCALYPSSQAAKIQPAAALHEE